LYFSIWGFTYAAEESRFCQPMCSAKAHGLLSKIFCAYMVAWHPRNQWGNIPFVVFMIQCIRLSLKGFFQFRRPSGVAVGNRMLSGSGIWVSHCSKIAVIGARPPVLGRMISLRSLPFFKVFTLTKRMWVL